MRRALGLALAALVLAAPAAAADEMGAPAEPARALAQQALALLERGRDEAAQEKLDQAIAATDTAGVDLTRLRGAHAALDGGGAAEAERLLRDVFPTESSHVVGVTYRPQLTTARVVAGLIGAALAAAAAAGLVRRRRSEARLRAG